MKAIVPGSGITVTASSDGRFATIDASSQLSASAPLIMIDNNTIMLDTSNLFFPVAPLHLTGDASGYSLIIDKGSLFTAVAPLYLTPSTPGIYNLTLGNLGNLGAATATTISTSGAATLNSLSVTNACTIGTTLGVVGKTSMTSATCSTTLGVTGALTVTGATSMTSATCSTSLGVTGATTLADAGRDREDDYDERDVFYDVRRRGGHFFSSPYMLWDGHI